MTLLILLSGIFINTIIVVSLLYILVRLIQNTQSKDRTIQNIGYGILVIVGLMITSLGTLFLYLQHSVLQTDLTTNETIFPYFLWAGYYIASLGYLGVFLKQTSQTPKTKYIVLLLVGFVFLISSLGMLEFNSWFNDGAILVVFVNQLADRIGTITSILIGIFALFTAVEQRLEYLQLVTPDVEPEWNQMTSYLVVVSFIFILQFSIPRVTAESILNPFMIKIVGLILITSLSYFVAKYETLSTRIKPWSEALTDDSDLDIVDRSDLIALGFGSIVLVLYGLAVSIDTSVLSVQEKIDIGYPILHLGTWFSYEVYADAFGVILPIIIAISAVVLALLKYSDWSSLLRFFSVYIIVNLSLSILLAILSSSIDLSSPLWWSPRFSIIPFIISPIIACVLSYFLVKNNLEESNNTLTFMDSKYRHPLILYTYSSSAVAALLFDITIARSPYGIIHLGAAGFLDGLFWAPLVSSTVLSAILIIFTILKLEI
ncbi:MAG: hypothetical protein RTU92_02810 [Candidatus Thorarchaeota archaeon]